MLEARDIRKAYGGIVALHGVDLTVRAGSVHALLGENGAGKSTLVKVLGGAVRPDSGTLQLDGDRVEFPTTAKAVERGVAVVSQELNLFPDLDVLANLFPMRERRRGPIVARRQMTALAEPVLAELGLDVSLRRHVGSLALAQRQLLEIARALVTQPRVLVLDEPTSTLEALAIERLMTALVALRERRVAVVYVSHVLEEVMTLSDEVTVLRDGRTALSGVPREQLTIPDIVDAMLGETGRDRRALSREALAAARAERRGSLSFEGVTVPGRLEEVSLKVEPGEVLGLAGLAGSGHSTVLEAAFGLRRTSAGRIVLPDGGPARGGSRQRIRRGVALVTGDRRRLGLMLDKPVWENIAQVRAVAMARAGLLISQSQLRARADGYVQRLGVRTPSVRERAGRLSGGNQQKVVFAKWLEVEPSLLLLDDPTRGVDVPTKADMHELIRAEAAAGAAVVFSSTDLDELVSVCDRVLVFFHGRICAELSGERLTNHALLEAMNTGAAADAA
jgi:ribose transport system ATP-binding protein